jgi:hypothetical protein
MATTTPNFGWPVPTSTDLVKDGATAIEGLGDAIDASLLDLKGGTTGQVLSKTSNTDMDFAWVAQDDSNAIQNAIVDAKGDIIVATANDTPARLAVGTNGQVLKANSATATGLEWASDSAGMTNPMTTTGDTIYSSSGSTPARLGIGSTGQVLTVSGGVPSWATPAGGGGAVVQVKSGTYNTGTTIASTSYTDTGLSLSITPTSASNKILVIVSQSFGLNRSQVDQGYDLSILRGVTNIFDQSGSDSTGYIYSANSTSGVGLTDISSLVYLDSPATTSATTYKTQARVLYTTNSGSVTMQPNSTQSTITLMEVTP